MANRKLGMTTDIRKSVLKNLTTDLIWHEKLETTEARAKEVKAIADSIIALACKEKDNYTEVDVKVVKAKLDSKGNKETAVTKSKNGNEFLKDENGNSIDLADKLFNVLGPRYEKRTGGYTQIIKLGQRRGDGAETVILKLV